MNLKRLLIIVFIGLTSGSYGSDVAMDTKAVHEVDINSPENIKAFFNAVRSRDAQVVKSFLERDIDVNVRDECDRGTLHIAVNLGTRDLNIVKLLLLHEANPNLQDTCGRTALMNATYNKVDKFKLLLTYGADPNLQDMWGNTVFDYAVNNLRHSEYKNGSEEIINMLKFYSIYIIDYLPYKFAEIYDNAEMRNQIIADYINIKVLDSIPSMPADLCRIISGYAQPAKISDIYGDEDLIKKQQEEQRITDQQQKKAAEREDEYGDVLLPVRLSGGNCSIQ